MRWLVLIAVFLISSVSGLEGHDGVDRPHGDLPDMPIVLSSSAQPEACADLCRKSSGVQSCVAWSFRKLQCGRPLCHLKAAITVQTNNVCWVSGVMDTHLLAPSFTPLPLTTLTPQGWLREQLVIQANGLSGHLALFWDDIMNSSWIGGSADTGLHERTPYWLNGFVPLAYLLDDPTLISLVHKYIDYILTHQSPDGWLGPDDITDGNAYWSKFPLLLALRQYYEANSSDSRVLPAMFKFLNAAHKRLYNQSLGYSWSGARWQDLVLTVHWLLDHHPSGQEQMLWDLAELLHQQGFDWKDYFDSNNFPTGPVSNISLYTHGVNIGQAIKSSGVWYRQSRNFSDVTSSYERMKKLDCYHGQASGMFGCDEYLAGNMPSRGTELCTVVESMFSYEVLFGILGDPIFAERAEQIGYNALPATLTPDMWAHQYLQQSNEMNAVHSTDHVWTHDGPNATLYGLAPNYGCCTANFNQGWPKFTEHVVMAHRDGLVVAMYAPVKVAYTLSSGVNVTLNMITEYPFGDQVNITVGASEGMTLSLRIPSWAMEATVSVNGSTKPAKAGTFYDVHCVGLTTIHVSLPMKIRVERRYNNAASIYRGALLYGLEIVEKFEVLEEYAFESRDYQVTPRSSWNYCLLLRNDSDPDADLQYVDTGLEMGVPPYSLKGAPGMILAKGRLLDKWVLSHNAAAAPPPSPVSSTHPLTPIVLLPFGATDLRIAEIPTTQN